MEEDILHVELMNKPTSGESQRKHCTHRSRHDHRTEGLSKIHTRTLSETPKNPSSLVALEAAVKLELMLVDPLALFR